MKFEPKKVMHLKLIPSQFPFQEDPNQRFLTAGIFQVF
jgi:hypothetical protein